MKTIHCCLQVFLVVVMLPLWMPIAKGGPPEERPNIVIIMSDDMGYSDIGCYGSGISTPNLDHLASNGLRFTQFYNTGRCCPTRASLLTGLYPHQAGIGWMMEDQGFDGYRGELNQNCRTLAEVMRPAGYGTYAVGKWHVTRATHPANEAEKHNWPLQRGFDHYYGIINGASSMWDPNSLTRDNTPITIHSDELYRPQQDFHLTDAISDNAAKYIDGHDFDEKPMFMYVAYTAAHWPLHARERDIARYQGKYDCGYDQIRQRRLARMKELGVIRSNVELSQAVGDWSKVPDPEWEADCMEVYAAMIDQMDQGIGRIVEALTRKGELDNTLIMFLQDNGGCAEPQNRSPDPQQAHPRADAPTLPEIASNELYYFSSAPNQTRDGWPVRSGHVRPGPADTYIAYGRNWANVSNTPLREFKHWVHEGGISTPLVVHWPAGFSQRNGLRDTPAHLIDLMATCVDVSGASYPEKNGEFSVHPMEGLSLVPIFRGEGFSREFLFWEHEGNRALRQGDWKLVAKGKVRDRELPVRWELYNIAEDRAELNDLSGMNPERVERLADLWNSKANETGVFPCPRSNN